MNAVLFCVFTAKVREKLKTGTKKVCLAGLTSLRCCKRRSYIDLQYSTNSGYTESQTKKVAMSENA